MHNQVKTYYWFLFFSNQLLLKKEGDQLTIPMGEASPFPVESFLEVPFHEAEIQGRTAFLSELVKENEDYVMVDLRGTWELIDHTLYLKAGKASELLYWDAHSKFCPVCATATEHLLPVMKKCPNCAYELYPVISAAVLVMVRKGDEILLIRTHNFRGPFHSLVAGFLDAGESLEECVVREVKEETGLSVGNITYWGSQPWPYPSGLMVGYVCDYAGGDIIIQEEELLSAAFYSKENLPQLPGKPSLARKMIDWWLSQQQASAENPA